jgi:acetylornithine deacetylase/succinyl-diaminopimelate desuccinylase-like protein
VPDLIERLLELAVSIQQIPAPTFQEYRRGLYVKELFEGEGLSDITMDSLHNVYARLPGGDSGAPLVVSAHLDTIFPPDVVLDVTREGDRILGPGIGDNSLGVAALFGLLWLLRERSISLPGDLWLVANVGEEGLGDLRGMRAVVDRFSASVQAYLVIEGMALGYVQSRALGVHRFRVRVQTAGGHSWSDHGQPSAVHEISQLVAQLLALELPEEPRTTLNVGRVSGGTSVNTIAAEAWLELDLRSEGPRSLDRLIKGVEHLVKMASRSGVNVVAETIGQRPAGELPDDHPLVLLAMECLMAQEIEPRLTIGSTDANVPLSQGLPAVVLGVTNGAGAHTIGEYIHVPPVGSGMEQLLAFVANVWKALDGH